MFPSYDHLRVFGCLCYPNLASTSPHKLSPHSTSCIYLGHSPDHKGHRCLEFTTQCLIIYCHVILMRITFLTNTLTQHPLPLNMTTWFQKMSHLSFLHMLLHLVYWIPSSLILWTPRLLLSFFPTLVFGWFYFLLSSSYVESYSLWLYDSPFSNWIFKASSNPQYFFYLWHLSNSSLYPSIHVWS